MRLLCPPRPAAACRPLLTLAVPFLLVLALAPPAWAATLGGRVIDPQGRPVAGAQVVVSTSLVTTAIALTDATGAFELELPPGLYDVRAIAPGFQAEPLAVSVAGTGRTDASLRLRVSAVSESIVVSASHVDLPLTRAADSVTVITAADLRMRQIETVSDALRLVPGLSVTRSGGRGAITSLFPRGGGSNYTLVLVDGMRVNSFGGGYDFSRLAVADIDRIELVRGPQSALFGSEAIGAVVQIVTTRGGPPRVDALVEGGAYGTARAAAGAAGARGHWTWGGGAERTDSDGYTGAAADGEPVTNDDYTLRHASGSLGWRRPGGADFLVKASTTHDARGFPGPFGSDPHGVFPGVDRVSRGVNDTRQIGGRFGHAWSATLRQRVDASFTDVSSDFESAFGPSTSGTRRIEARLQEDVAIVPALSASAGVQLLRERGSSSFITGPAAEPIPIERSVTGAYGELRFVGGERLFVTGGLRLERLERSAVEADPLAFVPRPAFPAQTVSSWNPKVAASYLLTRPGGPRATRLRASAGAGIRPPDAFEIAFTDNPDLAPERSRSVDAGIEQQLAGGALLVTATAFLNRYDDLIVTVGRSLADASRYRTDNISNARARGVELAGDARLPRGMTLRASYTFLSTEVLSVDGLERLAPAPFKVGDALIRRPRHQGVIEATYASSRVSVFADLTLRSQILDLEPNYGSFGGLFFSAGYSVLNAGLSIPIRSGVEVYARGLNLADRSYEETLGYPALGRSAMVGVRVAAGR